MAQSRRLCRSDWEIPVAGGFEGERINIVDLTFWIKAEGRDIMSYEKNIRKILDRYERNCNKTLNLQKTEEFKYKYCTHCECNNQCEEYTSSNDRYYLCSEHRAKNGCRIWLYIPSNKRRDHVKLLKKVVLNEINRSPGLHLRELGKKCELSPSSVKNIVDHLERDRRVCSEYKLINNRRYRFIYPKKL